MQVELDTGVSVERKSETFINNESLGGCEYFLFLDRDKHLEAKENTFNTAGVTAALEKDMVTLF